MWRTLPTEVPSFTVQPMATIQVDEQTAAAITAKAAAQGVSVSELRQGVGGPQAEPKPRLTEEEFDRMFARLSVHAPPLPPDFSRVDIYIDHG